MGAKGAVEIIFRHVEDRTQAEKEYIDKFANPIPAAQRGFLDDIILPATTRRRIIEDLITLKHKKLPIIYKKHDNMPL